MSLVLSVIQLEVICVMLDRLRYTAHTSSITSRETCAIALWIGNNEEK
jgi:hypothetical protein